ncbi:hypothetical protein HPP92_001636 [Vanilla planifolia]|uniref:Uncharacterized protein n=1 Tax=Vanilla planifolia TaxID=51239 RepID=A0A835VH87_VANPL|nr:hypothetical protein HPP92_001636 [Vanilla planifolia]
MARHSKVEVAGSRVEERRTDAEVEAAVVSVSENKEKDSPAVTVDFVGEAKGLSGRL